jgi:endoglucanase
MKTKRQKSYKTIVLNMVVNTFSMAMRGVISFLFMSFIINGTQAQTGVGDNFNNNVLSCKWTANTNYALSEVGSELVITGNNAGVSYNNFSFSFNTIDISSNPVISVQIKTTTALSVRMDLTDANGNSTNASPVSKAITNSGTYSTFTFNYTGKFNQSNPSTATVDPTQITQLAIFFNPGGTGYNGTVYFDNLQIGTGGPTDGGGSTCSPPINYNIRLNQIGFYPNLDKIAIVAGNPAAGSFSIQSLDLSATFFTGTLGASATWSYSNETVRAADFSTFTTPGTYVLYVPGVGYSPPFIINPDAFNILSKTVLKGYYYKRASTAITSQYGGVYARAEGHPDTGVQIHASAASPGRPAGTVVSSPKGWYDAGDYGSYVVNSGISTYTLLSSYEHFQSYYDTLPLNIPESGDGIPDILNEIKWNLDWMLTMQDPYDGGVYHKKTTLAFSPFEMPDADQAQRYLIGKATAATFDFAAVMAVAYRAYLPYDATYANQCLAAAKSAYTWGIANPGITFSNPSDVSTGEYGDGTLTDEKEWAATELYISTKDNSYYANSFKNTNSYGIPSWPTVNTLGIISLVHHRKNLTALGFADTTAIKNKLFAIANPIRTYKTTSSAYKTGMGTNGNADFIWGSNSVALNEGIICMSAYLATKDLTYLNTAISELDYILGRNATTYSLVSGLGSKPVMNPHDRISSSDGIVNPIPGWMAGGPNTDSRGDCGASAYPSTYKACSYVDNSCSYSTNEIAINWNAPLVFVGIGVQYINRTDLNPVIQVLNASTSIPSDNNPAVSMGTSLKGTAANTVTLTINNAGAVPLLISSITGDPGFVVGTLTPASPIAAGASSTFTISATPANAGINTGKVIIQTNDQTNQTFTLNLSVTGTAPEISVTQNNIAYINNGTAYSFPNTVHGNQSSAVAFTITNTGTAVLTLGTSVVTGPFQLTGPSVSSLAAGSTTTFSVVFAPATTGNMTGTVSIPSDADDSPFILNLSGDGIVTTGTIGVLASDAILIAPNPTNGNVSVQMNGVFSNISINVYNALGEQLISNALSNANHSSVPLTLTSMAAGIYFIEVISDQGTSMKRVIKE